MGVTAAEIAEVIEEHAPLWLAEESDNVGFQVGDPEAEVECVLVTTDVTAPVVVEAREMGAGLIVSHHPLIMPPLSAVRSDDLTGRVVADLIRGDIGLYVAHTNLDKAPVIGTAAALAEVLGVADVAPLIHESGRRVKLVVFTPEESAEGIREAMAAAGAGVIGDYTHCSFAAPGTGSFLGGERADPAVGEAGRLERVPELRLEMVCPRERASAAIAAMLAVHPYEEPAFDVIPLANVEGEVGLGGIGDLREPRDLGELAAHVERALGGPAARVSGPRDAVVQRVAVFPGSTGRAFPAVLHSDAEALVGGEIKHHWALAGLADPRRDRPLCTIEAGHHATERPVVGRIVAHLREILGAKVRLEAASADVGPYAGPQ